MLKELIRMMIQENKSGFLNKSSAMSYEGDFDDPLFSSDPDIKKRAKDVKRLWAAEADHAFMNSVVKIHWLEGVEFYQDDLAIERIKKIMQASGRDEISTMGYIKEPYSTGWGDIGLVLKGRTTLAANNMDRIASGYHSDLHGSDFIKRRYKSSGIPKRPYAFKQSFIDDYIFDKNDFDLKSQGHNEFILDNWKVIGLVFRGIDKRFLSLRSFERIYRIVKKTGLPFFLKKDEDIFNKRFDKVVEDEKTRIDLTIDDVI
jgi:hypothetical protein